MKARVRSFKKLFQTIVAHRQISGNTRRRPFPARALPDTEIFNPHRFGNIHFNFRNLRSFRRRGLQFSNERFEAAICALQENVDTFIAVRNPSRQRIRTREPKHKRAESNALYDSANLYRTRAHSGLGSDDAAPSLPSNLDNFALVHEYRHGSLAARKRAHPFSRRTVCFHVILDEIVTPPFKPFPHFLRLRATRHAE
jgi:hypothetical protein